MDAFRGVNWLELTSLDLSHNLLGCQGLSDLVSSRMRKLEYLNVEDAGLDARAIHILAVSSWPRLQRLQLSSNNITVSADSICSLTEAWRWLVYLHLPKQSVTPWLQSYLDIKLKPTMAEIATRMTRRRLLQFQRGDVPLRWP